MDIIYEATTSAEHISTRHAGRAVVSAISDSIGLVNQLLSNMSDDFLVPNLHKIAEIIIE